MKFSSKIREPFPQLYGPNSLSAKRSCRHAAMPTGFQAQPSQPAVQPGEPVAQPSQPAAQSSQSALPTQPTGFQAQPAGFPILAPPVLQAQPNQVQLTTQVQLLSPQPLFDKIALLEAQVHKLEREKAELLGVIHALTVERESSKKKIEDLESMVVQLKQQVEKLQKEVDGFRSKHSSRQLALDLERDLLHSVLVKHDLRDRYSDKFLSVKIFWDDYEHYKNHPEEVNMHNYHAAWHELNDIAKSAGFILRRGTYVWEFKTVLHWAKQEGMSPADRSKLQCDERLIKMYETRFSQGQ